MNERSPQKTVAVFGGTFDPPHLGHISVAKAILKRRVELVLFVPGANPPHKLDQTISPFHNREAMLKIALRNLSGAMVSDVERELVDRGPSYTCLMMDALCAKHPEWSLSLLIGEDSLRQLHTWRDADNLVRKWPILTYPRKDDADSETSLSEALRMRWPSAVVDKLLGGVIEAPPVTISSTEIRKRLLNGEKRDTITKWMDPKVADYVVQHDLYC